MPRRTSLPEVIDLLVRAFFREVEVTGLEHVPQTGGGILVSWHPNGLVDPALIFSQFPRGVVFGARDGLFKWPLLGALMRHAGTVPIRRAADAADEPDPEKRRATNRASLETLARTVADGSFAALFPEGVSHDDSQPVEMKTGAARLYYLARELQPAGAPAPAIVPVGLFYDRKHRFRSRALVEFHPPLRLPATLDVDPTPDEPDEAGRERARALTALVEEVLHDAVGATEDWATHDLLQRVRKLLHAERGGGHTSLRQETAEFAQIHDAYVALRTSAPQRTAALRIAVDHYDRDLLNLGLEDTELDGDPPLAAPGLLWLVLLQALLVFLLLPPVLAIGFLVNAPVALAVRGIALLAGKFKKDQATIKLLAAVLLYPLAWIAVGVVGWKAHVQLHQQYGLPDAPVAAGVALTLIAMIGGALALFYLEFARATARSIRVRLTRMQRLRSLARLRGERARLAAEFRAMSADAP
ncbi:MAG TPA: 1-acyl-sn-glycerol-3-phosphate acyltransferase [Solimonas sp.]|nr:1-acyl-sn-glycerol-3-phosphate acyltransferase [Solimonas sp.]